MRACVLAESFERIEIMERVDVAVAGDGVELQRLVPEPRGALRHHTVLDRNTPG
jgi:hypothetical protein